ncbi:hypothetical protein COOONC_21519 [Cooperia oncophora]
MLPSGSQFYGADPIYEKNAELYSEVGQFFPLAVGNETKVSKAYVMPKELGGYAYKLLSIPFTNYFGFNIDKWDKKRSWEIA